MFVGVWLTSRGRQEESRKEGARQNDFKSCGLSNWQQGARERPHKLSDDYINQKNVNSRFRRRHPFVSKRLTVLAPFPAELRTPATRMPVTLLNRYEAR